MAGGNAPKRKGYTFEKEIEHALTFDNHKCIRAWGSNGKSIGHEEDVDLVFKYDTDEYKIQAKRKKSLPKWMATGNSDWLAYREDRGEMMIAIPIHQLLTLIK